MFSDIDDTDTLIVSVADDDKLMNCEIWDSGKDDGSEEQLSDELSSNAGDVSDNSGGYKKNDTGIVHLKSLEEEHEMLATSLMALTSHFAQVQFRLRQVVEAPVMDRDKLLKNLEEFAFRGIPEISGNSDSQDNEDVITNLERARVRQCELISLLKAQLSELEKVAYDSGAPILPQSILVEKQKIIIDELKNKLNLNVNEFELPDLTPEELRSHVDTALGEFVGPFKMKEQLVAQLKTQITDLERFIAFLQCDSEETRLNAIVDGNDKKNNSAYNTYSAKKKSSGIINNKNSDANANGAAIQNGTKHQRQTKRDTKTTTTPPTTTTTTTTSSSDNFQHSLSSKAHGLMDRASTLLQMFAISQIACRANRIEKNTLKKTLKINHWGDIRAQLEIDIQKLLNLVKSVKKEKEKLMRKNPPNHDDDDDDDNNKNFVDIYADYSTDSDDTQCEGEFKLPNTADKGNLDALNCELTTHVRKNFAVTLQRLIQHGLYDEQEAYNSLVPFVGCFASSRSDLDGYYFNENDDYFTNNKINKRQMHAWELIVEYYHIKNGDKFNETPARKLSQSFNLNIVGGQTVSSNQNLLSAVGSIIAMHGPYRRSHNSHFKAFVCAALNAHKLVVWLNLILQCTELISTYYTNWSYTAKTGFRDTLRSLDTLTKFDFDLPVDLAVRQFRNINDIFM